RPELLIEPAHWLGKECSRFLCESAALLVQLGTQAAQRTSPTRELLAVVMYAVHEGEQPSFRGSRLHHSLPKRPKLGQAARHDGFTEFFLGLEVVIDIAKWDTGRLRDIGETC